MSWIKNIFGSKKEIGTQRISLKPLSTKEDGIVKIENKFKNIKQDIEQKRKLRNKSKRYQKLNFTKRIRALG